MDDTDKTQGQTQTQQQPQMGGVATLVKERELPVTSSAGPSVSEFVMPSGSEAEHKIDRELAGMDVRPVTEFPTVGPEEQKAGIRESTPPVKTEPSGLVQTPMTEEEARQTAKHEKPENALKWFAALIVKHFNSIHHNLIQNSKFKSQNYK